MADLNNVTVVGRLTRDPDVRHTSAGMPIVLLGIAVNGRQKNTAGEWVDKANFFDVKFFGERFERAAQHLAKGKRVGVTGRLEYSQWEKDGAKRSKVEVVGTELQFLDARDDAPAPAQAPDTSDFVPVGVSVADDDVPF